MLISMNFNRSFPFTVYISAGLFFVSALILAFCFYSNTKFGKMYRSLYYREELFNSLCTNLDDILLIYRFEGFIVEYISPNLERLYGFKVKDFKRNPFRVLNQMSPPVREEITAYFTTKPLTTNKVIEFEMFNPVRKKTVSLLLRIYPVYDRQHLKRYILSISDITMEKETQQVLRDALINTQKANEAKKEFLSHMSHEIRTPLNTINGMAQIALRSLEDDQKVESCLFKISDSSQKLISLVSNILDMSRIDSNKLILNRDLFQLDQLIYELSELFHTQAEMKHLKFNLLLKNIRHKHLLGDPLRLNQIISNCISNSLKFTPSGGSISLDIEEQGAYGNNAVFCFTIRDTGKGMSKDFIDRLFLPFEQEDSSIARNYGGTGLGMSITKNLVTLMSGDIEVSSNPGQGTSITIHIPFETLDELSAKQNLQVPEHKQIDFDFQGCKALVVEDNDINREVICEFLKYANIRVETACGGKEALRMFENSAPGDYRLIFMDIQMPDQTGYETARQIRSSKHPDAASISIIAMSADSYAEDIACSLEAGMNDHISKPIDMRQLYQLIGKLMAIEDIKEERLIGESKA